MEIKEKIDLLSKKSDVINKKVIAFLAIAGGSWIYGVKSDGLPFWLGLVIFVAASFGTITNLLKLGDIEKKMKDLENE